MKFLKIFVIIDSEVVNIKISQSNILVLAGIARKPT